MSRRAAEEKIAAGRVQIDGRTAVLGDRVDVSSDIVRVDGKILPVNPESLTFLLYKPVGVISTAEDPQKRTTVVDLIDFVAAGLVDHMHLVQVPIVLGRGVRVWDGLEALEDDYDIEAVSTPSGVTHLTFTRKAD
jgi:hypothetical protein